MEGIEWPFLISGLWCVLGGIGYIYLGFASHHMPVYQQQQEARGGEGEVSSSKLSRPILSFVCFMLFLFYTCSGAVERVFQSMATTWSLCGPLALSPSMAALTDSFYSGGFMFGRLASIPLASCLRPTCLVTTSTLGVLLAALFLYTAGPLHWACLYPAAALVGLLVSWQFGAAFSWAAKRMDVTGRISPIFFLGCGLGSLAAPPIAGALFR